MPDRKAFNGLEHVYMTLAQSDIANVNSFIAPRHFNGSVNVMCEIWIREPFVCSTIWLILWPLVNLPAFLYVPKVTRSTPWSVYWPFGQWESYFWIYTYIYTIVNKRNMLYLYASLYVYMQIYVLLNDSLYIYVCTIEPCYKKCEYIKCINIAQTFQRDIHEFRNANILNCHYIWICV